jgi:type IV secretion system protein VirD4
MRAIWKNPGSPVISDFAIPYGYNADGTFPSYADNRHLLTFGPTRSGKGATVIVQALLRAPHSVICVDPKGQNAAITARRRGAMGDVYCLNPFGLHTGEPWNLPRHRFNPLAHLKIENENLVAEVASLAEALILTEGKEPYFDNTARDLVKLCILHLVAEKEQSGGDATLAKVRRYLTLPEREFVELLVEMKDSSHPFVAQAAPRFLREVRDIQSAISSAITQTAFLDDPNLSNPQTGTLTGSDFTMLQLKRRPTTVFLVLPGRFLEAYARFFRLIITSAIDQLASDAGGHPTLLMLDEFATLQNLHAVSKAFGFAAGFNLQCWAFLQDLPQLKAVYGDKWESFIANAGLLQFFTPADMTTAEYLQRRGGEKSTETVGKQVSPWWGIPRSISVSPTREPLLRPELTMSMTAREQVVFFAGKHSAFSVGRAPYWEIPRLNGLWDSDPYQG